MRIRSAGCGRALVLLLLCLGGTLNVHAQVIGWATQNGGTTGGAGGVTVTVDNRTDLLAALNSATTTTIMVDGNIDLGGARVIQNKSNKSIIGLCADAGWLGNFQFKNCHNFIIQNMNISSPAGADGMTIQDESENFWVDHCSFGDCADGQLDITHGSSFITVSWCKFFYVNQTDHKFSSLVGHDDNNGAEDTGRLLVTYHHNYWSSLVTERMPRLRFGRVHLFNNYYNSPGNAYCASARIDSEMLIENNYFENVRAPWAAEQGGKIKAAGNALDQTTGSATPTGDTVFVPPYAYTLQSAAEARTAVIANAGAGACNSQPVTPSHWRLE